MQVSSSAVSCVEMYQEYLIHHLPLASLLAGVNTRQRCLQQLHFILTAKQLFPPHYYFELYLDDTCVHRNVLNRFTRSKNALTQLKFAIGGETNHPLVQEAIYIALVKPYKSEGERERVLKGVRRQW